MSDLLMPCPFCGGEASEVLELPACRAFVKCRGCDAQTWSYPADRKAESVTDWNRRADDGRSIALAVQLTKNAERFRSYAQHCRDYGWDAMAAEFNRHGDEAEAVLAKATKGEASHG